MTRALDLSFSQRCRETNIVILLGHKTNEDETTSPTFLDTGFCILRRDSADVTMLVENQTQHVWLEGVLYTVEYGHHVMAQSVDCGLSSSGDDRRQGATHNNRISTNQLYCDYETITFKPLHRLKICHTFLFTTARTTKLSILQQ